MRTSKKRILVHNVKQVNAVVDAMAAPYLPHVQAWAKSTLVKWVLTDKLGFKYCVNIDLWNSKPMQALYNAVRKHSGFECSTVLDTVHLPDLIIGSWKHSPTGCSFLGI